MGYLLLKRRHAGDATGNIEKNRLFKSSGPVQSSATAQGKVLPTGPPPGQVSRHTAYAVPPLPKSSSSSGSRGSSPSSVAFTSKTPAPPPSTAQRLEQLTQPSTSVLNSTLRDQYRPEQVPRSSPSGPSQSPLERVESVPPINRIPPDSARTGFPQQWKPESAPSADRGPDSNVFPRLSPTDFKPGTESHAFGPPLGQAPRPPQPSQTPFPVSKWTPPDQKGDTQWTDPVPKPGLAAPQKWAPPPGQGLGPRPPQGGPPRPGAGPVPGPTGQRPPFPPGQGPPRPLGFPSPIRPGQPGPVGVPAPFRSDQQRPPGLPPQARPFPPPGGSLPQPWSAQKPADKGEQESAQSRDFGSSLSRPQVGPSDSSRGSAEKAPEPGGGGEMDWDTALDTILKTLKKDRGVGEKG